MARFAFASLVICVIVLGNCDCSELTGVALANNYFGLNLLNQLSTENDLKSVPENIFFSPYSISLALAMLHQGVGGNSAKQLDSSLGYQLAKLDQLDKSALAGQILELDKSNSSNYILKTSNALITGQQAPVLDSYKQNLQNNFKAQLFSIDFSRDASEAKDLINQWCSNNTNGKIPKLLSDPPSPDTVLALINAVYFKATWKDKFEKYGTVQNTFNGLNGLKYENVSFMSASNRFKVSHLNDLNATMIELPYKGQDVSLFAILPSDKSAPLTNLKKALNASYIESKISESNVQGVHLKFPKLNFKTNIDLVTPLKALGITEVFDSKVSNFSFLSSLPKLAVDQVKHAATIEVDEDGTEAAAATSITVSTESLLILLNPIELKFDHPFVFFIRHNRNGQLLFVGEVNQF